MFSVNTDYSKAFPPGVVLLMAENVNCVIGDLLR